jgi:NAD(P)-dependent dehydrogenase (short-subunit alcohol dehydrogenase family)
MKRSNSLSTLALAAAATGAAGLLALRLLRPRLSFENRVVLITGGSRGLGLALARQFAREGASLALLARDRAELDRACDDLRQHGATAVLPIPCDVRKESQVQEAIAMAVSLWGKIDVLVNNAGIITVGPLHTMTNRDFEEAFALHFWAPLYTIQASLPYLKRSDAGRIVNISSFGGKVPVPHMAPYVASKFALVGLSEALRTELHEDGIRVTTVCPGLMRTGSHLNAFFKGAHEQEFAWFSAGMGIPGSAMAADRAAKKIVEAARAGRPELVLSLKAKAAVLAHSLMPNTVAHILEQVNRAMPHSADGVERKSGWDSRSATPPAFTKLADEATEEFNGLRGHPTSRRG